MSKTSKGFFIAGTDTGVGKTTFACYLLAALKARGYSTAALKPIASGSELKTEGIQNEDGLLLQAAATLKLPYEWVNPYAFIPPIAPHIAANKQGIELTVNDVLNACGRVLNSAVDYIIIEGAGGFKVPLNAKETFADLAVALGFPVILVVGLKLGCLNQSLLTYDAIQNSGLELAGWLGCRIDENMLCMEENIEFLKRKIKAPFLGLYPQCFISRLLDLT